MQLSCIGTVTLVCSCLMTLCDDLLLHPLKNVSVIGVYQRRRMASKDADIKFKVS